MSVIFGHFLNFDPLILGQEIIQKFKTLWLRDNMCFASPCQAWCWLNWPGLTDCLRNWVNLGFLKIFFFFLYFSFLDEKGFAQQIETDKGYHWKAHEILYKKPAMSVYLISI